MNVRANLIFDRTNKKTNYLNYKLQNFKKDLTDISIKYDHKSKKNKPYKTLIEFDNLDSKLDNENENLMINENKKTDSDSYNDKL